jgi:hypothetical protein
MRTTFTTRIDWKESQSECYSYDAYAHHHHVADTHNPLTADEKRSLELLERILAAKDRKPFKMWLLVDAMGFDSQLAMETIRMLLLHNTHPIDQDEMTIAVHNTRNGARNMALLLSHIENTNITERMMLEAAKNITSPVLSLFLQQRNHPTVTEELIQVAISGVPHICANPWLVQHVLAHSGGLAVSEETLMLAMDYDGNDGELLKIFLEHQVVPITANHIEAALRTGCYAADLLHALFTHGQEMPISIEQELKDKVYGVLENHPEASGILTKLGGCSTSTEYIPLGDDLAVCTLQDVVPAPIPTLELCPTCHNLQEPAGYITWKTLCSSAEAGCRYCFVIQQSVQHTSQAKICPNEEIAPYVGQSKGPLVIQVIFCHSPDCCPQNANLDWRDKNNVHRMVDLYIHEGMSFSTVAFPPLQVMKSLPSMGETRQLSVHSGLCVSQTA